MMRAQQAKEREYVASREEAIDKFMVAGRKHLTGIRTEEEIRRWAERTADQHIARGIVVVKQAPMVGGA